jgi:hypothetical protein
MAVDPASTSAATQVTGAIRQAARSTGASFDYLLATARIESNLNPQAQASTSSAKGLYQFIEQTWLSTMKTSGASLGFGAYADAISYNASSGRYEVADPAMRNSIMQLRSDPSASAAMAGAFTRNNSGQLSGSLGRRPTDGELYIAHFLGPDGAGRLINAANSQPSAAAADMFPSAAQSNRSIFYDHSGRARGTAEVYAVLANKYDAARVAAVAPGLRGSMSGDQVASAGYVQDAMLDKLAPIPNAAAAQKFAAAVVPNTAVAAQAYAQTDQSKVMATLAGNERPPADDQPLFRSMFSSRGENSKPSPVAPVVQALWQGKTDGGTSGQSAAKTVASADAQLLSGSNVNTLQLFQDIQTGTGKASRGIGRPGFSGMFSDDG